MPDRFDKFIHEENLKNFARQIKAERESARLAILVTLEAEEKARAKVTRTPHR